MPCCASWTFIAHGLGCLVLTKFLYQTAMWIYTSFFRPAKRLQEYGEWAIVTGATDGIGKAIALELAKVQKLKVLLISRNPERLAETKKEVETANGGLPCEVLALDMAELGRGESAALAKVTKSLQGKKVAVLVNNVGISYEHPQYFDQLDMERIGQLIHLNVGATTYMTKLVLSHMLVAKNNGCIISIASSSATVPCPLLAEYSAAKEYVIRFSQSLHAEYASKGISFQVQPVHFVTSKLSKIRHATLTTPSPTQFAKASVAAFGYEREISPYWSHYPLVGLMKTIPTELLDKIMMTMHLGIRGKALKKKAAQGKEQ